MCEVECGGVGKIKVSEHGHVPYEFKRIDGRGDLRWCIIEFALWCIIEFALIC